MDCRETQSKIPLFLMGNLDLKQLKIFLKHTQNCPSCMDELEAYYILYSAMQILGNDSNAEEHMDEIDLKKELGRAEEKLRRAKRKSIQKKLFFIFIIIAIGIFVL